MARVEVGVGRVLVFVPFYEIGNELSLSFFCNFMRVLRLARFDRRTMCFCGGLNLFFLSPADIVIKFSFKAILVSINRMLHLKTVLNLALITEFQTRRIVLVWEIWV